MNKSVINSKAALLSIFVITVVLIVSCTAKDDANESWDIAPAEYASMAEQSLRYMENFDFDTWGEMLADDVEYYFPDGDAGIRTVLIGKRAVIDWWNNWQMTSGIEEMTFTEPVFLPVVADEVPNYTGLPGYYVVSYFSNKMIYNGKEVNIRMNFTMHFNDDQKIDRYFTYYDRTPIIEAVQTNILRPADPDSN
ncbi:nuclear transport factor 2 family protein [Balneola sp. MJW-20]|uniref:nuclear transport factor 2 family protein n=1 Tax=Gracilimonas aurantiaca TaxID=3234185 RepID=UPI003465AA80